MYLPLTLRITSCCAEPIEFLATIVTVPAWILEFILGIVMLYLLLLTSFSIWTPSLAVNSFPFNCQMTVGFGKASMMHSNLTVSSFWTAPIGSGSLVKTGLPIENILAIKN